MTKAIELRGNCIAASARFVAVCLAAAVSITAASTAGADTPGPDILRSERVTPGPERGFTGFRRYGARNFFCDYRRIPNRTCRTDRHGQSHCRVTSWTLQEYCY